MALVDLPAPEWDSLAGASDEAVWIADRDRKAELAFDVAERFRATAAQLAAVDATYRCSPEVLGSVPAAGDWYVSLAGFALKTLGNIHEGPEHFGLGQSPTSIVSGLRIGRRYQQAILLAFSAWINAEIDKVHQAADRAPDRALHFVLLILGGRIIGKGQNTGGDDAVVLVKSLLVGAFAERGAAFEVEVDGKWLAGDAHDKPLSRRQLRFGGRVQCDFTGGGNRPDMEIRVDTTVVAVAEVKGRKDTSNIWESWMPQVVAHMETWTGEYPNAARVLFGTFISEEMISGVSSAGTRRNGLRDLYAAGLLTGAYNVAKIATRDPAAERGMKTFVSALCRLRT